MEIASLFGLSLLGSVAGLAGGAVFFISKKFSGMLASVAIPLAAGVLLALTFLELLPESIELLGENTYLLLLVVFVGFFLVERFLFFLHHHEGHMHESAVPLVLFGDTIHNFLDGAAIAAAFLVSPGLGLVVALATFLHETPHEIADFGILLSAGYSRAKAFWTNFFSALATIPGAFLTYYFSAVIENLEAYLLTVAAGLFLYIAATDFLPEVGHEHGKFSLKEVFFLLVGVGIMIGVGFAFPEMTR